MSESNGAAAPTRRLHHSPGCAQAPRGPLSDCDCDCDCDCDRFGNWTDLVLADHEIFRLRDEVATAEGANVTFYSLLGVKPSASQDDLTKAYRKRSRELHPDKARQIFVTSYAKKSKKAGKKSTVPSKKEIDAHMKKVTSSYQRLTVVANILKGPERERYDHFLRNGFPAWRGSGYYYARFRPGLGSVLFGMLVVMGGGMHYFALTMAHKRRREFVERYIRHARKTAWGDETAIQGIPGVDTPPVAAPEPEQEDAPENEEFVPRNRREKRAMEKQTLKDKKVKTVKKARSSGISTPIEAEIISGPQGAKKRIVAENGKVLIVDSVGNVFLEEETEDGTKGEFLLDVSFPPPNLHEQHILNYDSPTLSPRPRSTTPFCSSFPSSSTTSPWAVSSTRKSSLTSLSLRLLNSPRTRLLSNLLLPRTSTARRGSASPRCRMSDRLTRPPICSRIADEMQVVGRIVDV